MTHSEFVSVFTLLVLVASCSVRSQETAAPLVAMEPARDAYSVPDYPEVHPYNFIRGLTLVGDYSEWSGWVSGTTAAVLVDGDLGYCGDPTAPDRGWCDEGRDPSDHPDDVKVAAGCAEIVADLPAEYDLVEVGIFEDNEGYWNIDDWGADYWNGRSWKPLVPMQPSPEFEFNTARVSVRTQRLRWTVCESNGRIELTEVLAYGETIP